MTLALTSIVVNIFGIIFSFIGSAGLIYLFYALERGKKAGFLETWNSIKSYLLRFIGVNALIMILVLLIILLIFVCILVPILMMGGSKEDVLLGFSILLVVFGLIGEILVTIPACNVIIRKLSGREKSQTRLQAVRKEHGISDHYCVVAFWGKCSRIDHQWEFWYNMVYSMWITDTPATSIMQIIGLLIANPLFRVNNFLAFLILTPFEWSVLTLAYLEIIQKAGLPASLELESEPIPSS